MKLCEVLTGPDKFCKDWFALTKDGGVVHWDEPDAAQFCLRGGAFLAAGVTNHGEATRMIDDRLTQAIYTVTGLWHDNPAWWSNGQTFEAIKPVIAEYDRLCCVQSAASETGDASTVEPHSQT